MTTKRRRYVDLLIDDLEPKWPEVGQTVEYVLFRDKKPATRQGTATVTFVDEFHFLYKYAKLSNGERLMWGDKWRLAKCVPVRSEK